MKLSKSFFLASLLTGIAVAVTATAKDEDPSTLRRSQHLLKRPHPKRDANKKKKKKKEEEQQTAAIGDDEQSIYKIGLYNDAFIDVTDKPASNGVVHIVKDVLLPTR